MADITKPLQAFGNTGEELCPPGLSADKAAYCRTGLFEYNEQNGGNPSSDAGALKPEHSIQWTIGARFEPSSTFSLGADLWTVRLHDQINTVSENTAFGNGALYDSLFIVAPDPINGHPTLTFLSVPINTGNAFYQGIDIDGESHMATPIGKLTTRAHVTYMLRADYQFPGVPGYLNSLNKVGADTNVTFQWLTNLQASLETGAFTNTLTANFKPGYADDTKDYAAGRHVGNYNVFDWQTKYDFNKSFSVTGGIMNLFDKNPPISLIDQDGTGNARGYDGRYTNPLGRTFYANVTYKF
jgi:iron complex outermembrane receptor protein